MDEPKPDRFTPPVAESARSARAELAGWLERLAEAFAVAIRNAAPEEVLAPMRVARRLIHNAIDAGAGARETFGPTVYDEARGIASHALIAFDQWLSNRRPSGPR